MFQLQKVLHLPFYKFCFFVSLPPLPPACCAQVLPADPVNLQQQLDAAQTALTPLEQQRQQLQRKSQLRAGLFKWGGLTVVVGHLANFTRLTFWDLSWDVMVSYCSGG